MPTKAAAKSGPKKGTEATERKVSRTKAPAKKIKSDDEDDFFKSVPAKKEATERKVSRTKAKPKYIDSDDEEEDEDDFVKPAPAIKQRILKEESSELEGNNSKKLLTKMESDSEMDFIPTTAKNKGKAKAAPKRKRYVDSFLREDIKLNYRLQPCF